MGHNIKVLIVEDDPNIVELLTLYLEKSGYGILVAGDGEEGLAKYYDEQPDCIILDLMLPEMDGLEVCRTIRLDDRRVPILMLTGRGESYDIIHGLDIGADDYVVKPFDPNELIARMKSVLRRTAHAAGAEEVIEMANMTIIPDEHRLVINGVELFMPPREMALLHFFATWPNQVLSRQQLLDEVWGSDYEGDPRTVDVHIKRIRDKLLANAAEWSVKTVRGVGYRFEEKHDG